MRADKDNPQDIYADYWDWVVRSWHILTLLSLFASYFVYIITTEEV